jgi:hypothetical protein
MKVTVDPKTGKIVLNNLAKPLYKTNPLKNLTVSLSLEDLIMLAKIIGQTIAQELQGFSSSLPVPSFKNQSKIQIDETIVDVIQQEDQTFQKKSEGKITTEKTEEDSSLKQHVDKLKSLKKH